MPAYFILLLALLAFVGALKTRDVPARVALFVFAGVVTGLALYSLLTLPHGLGH